MNSGLRLGQVAEQFLKCPSTFHIGVLHQKFVFFFSICNNKIKYQSTLQNAEEALYPTTLNIQPRLHSSVKINNHKHVININIWENYVY